jgi:3,4-dihydroxy 2-butanone 4-phosphate synthase/GTP cyclohydrolase II
VTLVPRTTTTRVVETVLPTRHGTFRMLGYRGADGTEHVALTMGMDDGADLTVPPLVRLHSECLTGDALGSRRCDCGTQLDAALARIAAEGYGVLVYVRGHEGRGIGLVEKLRAYQLQDAGHDTVDANLLLGHPSDAREYGQAADVLLDLGASRIRLMSSNPAKERALRAHGVNVVERTGLFVPEVPENVVYLRTKRRRMQHDVPPDDAWAELVAGRVPFSSASDRDAGLVDWYGPMVAAGQDVVVAQLAQSLDGFIAAADGDSRDLSGPEDHEHLHRLRALVDAVVVGARTVVADDPRLTVREVVGPDPVRVVLDPSARTPCTATLLTDGGPTLWLVGPRAHVPPVGPGVEVVRLEPADFEPAAILGLLRRRGLSRVLVEGGGRTVSTFVEAGCVDRLYLTSVPLLLGEGVPGIRLPAASEVADAPRLPWRRLALGADLCTELVFPRASS